MYIPFIWYMPFYTFVCTFVCMNPFREKRCRMKKDSIHSSKNVFLTTITFYTPIPIRNNATVTVLKGEKLHLPIFKVYLNGNVVCVYERGRESQGYVNLSFWMGQLACQEEEEGGVWRVKNEDRRKKRNLEMEIPIDWTSLQIAEREINRIEMKWNGISKIWLHQIFAVKSGWLDT